MTHTIERITTSHQRALATQFVNTNHSYIRWADRPSRKLYWMLYEANLMVGVFGLGSAYTFPKTVKAYMVEKSLAFNQVANNIVYCLTGCKDRNSGSRFLSLCRKDAVRWWKERYGDDLLAFQTFILPPRTGAVYKADNWIQLGTTSGGKSLVTRTLSAKDKDEATQVKVFKSGEVRYLQRTFVESKPKLIFMRIA